MRRRRTLLASQDEISFKTARRSTMLIVIKSELTIACVMATTCFSATQSSESQFQLQLVKKASLKAVQPAETTAAAGHIRSVRLSFLIYVRAMQAGLA